MDFQNVFLTVWNMSLTGSIIIGFVLLARLVLRKAPKVFSYALWSVVLFRLLCPVSVSSMFSVLNFTKAAEPVSQSVVTTMDYSAMEMPEFIPVVENEPEIEEPVMIEPEFNEPQIETPVIPDDGMEYIETPDVEVPQAPAEPARDPIHYAVIIWLVGLGVMLIYNVISCIRLFRQIEGAVPLRKELYLADYISTAFVLGIINPKIYLPSYLSPEERGYIIAHERCHIKRMDHVFRLLAYLALCLHWFNPLVWLAFVLSGKDMEMSCDEAVIRMYGPRIRAEYSQSLLRLATGHRSFALTPLAFGEGDTKERVMNMSTWKKPKTWATIIALVVCIGVLVACATNPASEMPTVGSMEESTTGSEKEVYWDAEVGANQACADAIQKLIDSESYCIVNEAEAVGKTLEWEYRKHGEDYLVQCSDGFYGSRLFVDGKGASFYGDYWVWGDLFSNIVPDEWLYRWSPDFVEISHIHASQNTVSFDVQWAEEPGSIYKDRHYKGTLTYTFNPDGSLQSIKREYVALDGDVTVSATVETLRPKEETEEDTYAAIMAVAGQCIPEEELVQRRQERKTVTEIPSNKTDFDTDYELGSVQMRWYFFGQDWQFAFGAEDATPTSATLIHLESNDGHKSLVAEEAFWLEQLVDGKWQYLDENKTGVATEKQNVDVAWDKKDSYVIDWSDSYGTLEPGFYRLGRYYTVTLDSGESETRPCYAKFRIMGEDWEKLLTQCEDALEELLSRDSYHVTHECLLATNANADLPYTIITEIWKSGEDYLKDAQYIDRNDTTLLRSRYGIMIRDGIAYDLDWSGREVESLLSFWSTNTYASGYDIERLWAMSFEWYESSVVDVVNVGGHQISIMMELGEGSDYMYREVQFVFNIDGSLDHINNMYHPTEGITKMRDKVVEDMLIVWDTSDEDIRKLIESQDVSKPMPFTYEMDVEEYPDAKKEGFANTTQHAVGTMEDAIRLADKECTMLEVDAISGERYNMTEVYYDETAKIWKVVFRFSQDSEGGQAIYLDNQGITQMIVTYTEENDPANIG